MEIWRSRGAAKPLDQQQPSGIVKHNTFPIPRHKGGPKASHGGTAPLPGQEVHTPVFRFVKLKKKKAGIQTSEFTSRTHFIPITDKGRVSFI